MRRTLALTALLAVVACWTGCSSGNSPSANSPATNPNTTAPSTSGGGNMSNANRPMNTSAAPAPVGSTPPGGIKPPMRDEKKK